jgi:hypothetical protein
MSTDTTQSFDTTHGQNPSDVAADLASLSSAESAPATTDAATTATAGDGSASPDAAAKSRVFNDPVRASIMQRYSEAQRAATDESMVAVQNATRAALPPDMGGLDDGNEATGGGSPGAGAEAAAVPGGAAAADALETVTVKVYGNDIVVPKAVVDEAGGVAAYQKALAVDAQLRAASTLTKQLQNELAAVQQQRAAGATTTTAASLPTGEQAAGVRTDAAREAMEALLETDADRFSSAINKVIEGTVAQRLQQATQAAPQTAAQPAPTVGSRSLDEIQAANNVFATEFNAVASNTAAFQQAQDLMRARMADPAFAAVPLDVLARDVGARVAKLMSGSAVAPQGGQRSTADQLALRRAAKARLPAAPSAGAGRTTLPNASPAESYAQRQSSYIKQLRQRSGSNSALAERGTR